MTRSTISARPWSKESRAFGSFVTNHTFGSEFVHLYSVHFRGKRGYTPKTKDGWKKELEFYARAAGYTGKISCFDLSSVDNWPNRTGTSSSDSAYVEFRRVFDQVIILYKPWSQCVYMEIKPDQIADGVNYRSTNQKGEVADKFWFPKATKSVTTNGSGFVLSPESLRLSFNFKG